MTPKTKILNNSMVAQEKSTKHKSNLESQVEGDAPHFKGQDKDPGEARIDANNRFVVLLLDVNKVKYVTKESTPPEGLKWLSMYANISKPLPKNSGISTKRSETGGLQKNATTFSCQPLAAAFSAMVMSFLEGLGE